MSFLKKKISIQGRYDKVVYMADEKKKPKESKPETAKPKETPKPKETANKGQPANEKKPAKSAAVHKKESKKEVHQGDAKAVSDAFDVIRFVLMTEKSIRLVESQNKLVFTVNRSSRRGEIKKDVQNAFGSPVSGVTTVIDQSGRKKAFVKFSNAGAAGDIAIKLGVI